MLVFSLLLILYYDLVCFHQVCMLMHFLDLLLRFLNDLLLFSVPLLAVQLHILLTYNEHISCLCGVEFLRHLRFCFYCPLLHHGLVYRDHCHTVLVFLLEESTDNTNSILAQLPH